MAELSPEAPSRSRVGVTLLFFPLAHGVLEIYGSMLSILWPVLSKMFGLSYGAVGALGMINRAATTLPQLGFAPLSDRFGSKWIAVIGLAAMAIGTSTIGLAPSIMILAVILFFAPLGSAAFHPSAASQVSRTFPRRRGFAIALFMIGGTLGSALGPKLGAWLVGNYSIRSMPWLIPMGVGFAVLLAIVLPSDRRKVVAQPQTLLQMFSTLPPAVFLIMTVQICQGWLDMSVQSYLPLLMVSRGEPLDRAATMLMVFSLLGAAGAFVGGTLSDRVPRWAVLALSLVCAAPLYVGTILARGPAVFLAVAAYGMAGAMISPVTTAMNHELLPTRLALASSLSMGISWVIASLGATLTGILADRIGVQHALLLNLVLPVVGLSSLFVLRRRFLGRAAAERSTALAGVSEVPEG